MKYDEKIGRLCRFYQKGKCKKGENCNFSHEDLHAQPAEPHRDAKTWDKPKVWQKVQGKNQWKNEDEEDEQQYHQYHQKDSWRNAGGNDYNYNTQHKNKHQGYESGTAGYSSYDRSSSTVPRKQSQPRW